MDRKLARIIDANINRAREGLRVCEDICRFLYDLRSATEKYKSIRHRLTQVVTAIGQEDVIKARDAVFDVGRPTLGCETQRRDVGDIFYANSQRVKESVRVLEECAKLLDLDAAEEFKTLRYQVYAIEKELTVKISRMAGKKK